MASFVYDSAREKFLTGDLSWTRDDIRVAILRTLPNPSSPNNPIKYVANETAQENHKSLADLPLSNVVSTSGIIYNKTFAKGIAGGDSVIFNEIQPGIELTSVVIYKRGLTNLQSYLIAHLDVQLITDSTRQVTIQWNIVNGQTWIFR
jgi:hypothetical protein